MQRTFSDDGMSSSPTRTDDTLAHKVCVTDEELVVELVDGRTVRVPVSWYPRVRDGTLAEKNNCRLIGRGEGIHWPELDEDVRVEDLLAGRESGETEESLQRWLEIRRKRR